MTARLNRPLAASALLTSILVLGMAPAAVADPTTGQRDRVGSNAQVNVGTTVISKMTSAFNTDTASCSTTETTLISKRIKQSAPGAVGVHYVSENFPGCRMLITLRRNGVIVPGPGDAGAPMAAHDTNGPLAIEGFNWTVANVPAGFSTFAVTCTCISGTSNIVDERSLLIYHQ